MSILVNRATRVLVQGFTGKQGTWYAYDVIVDGVSLVMNYRSQFTKIIAESSFQELLRRLRERPKQDLSKPKP